MRNERCPCYNDDPLSIYKVISFQGDLMILIATFTDKIIENIENNKNQSHEILSYRFLGFYKTLTQFLMSFIAASYFLTHVSTVRYNKYLDINNWDQSFRC
jgi:hypothetical protein